MSKKLLLLMALIVILTSSLLAQTIITPLTTHINATLNSTLTVTPTLAWTHTDSQTNPVSVNKYRVFISTSPDLASPVGGASGIEISGSPAAKTLNLATAPYVLRYDTVYFWQIRQYTSGNVEIENRSAIATFRTLKMSVKPHLAWSEITGQAGNYTISIKKGATEVYTKANIATTNFVLDELLEYNTAYTWTITRGTSTVNQYTFTTKPLLNLGAQIYRFDNAANPKWNVVENYDFLSGTRLFYAVKTDEFENLSAFTFIDSVSITSSISDPAREKLALTYSVPGENIADLVPNNIITGTALHSYLISDFLELIDADGLTAENSDINVTNNEIITHNFRNENIGYIRTLAPPYVDVANIYTSTGAYYGAAGGDPAYVAVTNMTGASPLFIQFNTGANTNNSIKVIVKNMNTGASIIRYAYKDGENNRYQMQLSSTILNALTTLNKADRISIYPEAQPAMKDDFLWTGNTPNGSATTFTMSTTSINPAGQVALSNFTPANTLVWVTSSLDPVGFVMSAGSFKIGTATDPSVSPAIIEAAILGPGVPSIFIKKLNGDNYAPAKVVEVINYALNPFTMQTPANFSLDVDIFPYLSWTSPLPTRGATDIFYYEVTIAENAALTTNPRTITTTNTYYYPEVDLTFGTTYYWKVVARQGGVNTNPSNLTVMGAWTFTTVAKTDNYKITGVIPANRTLTKTNSDITSADPVITKGYLFDIAPETAINTTLTIEDGVQLKFAPGKKLVIGGNIIADGTAGILFTTLATPPEEAPYTAALWQGIEFKHDASISRLPLIVDSQDKLYVSGSILRKVTFEYATKPISYQANAVADIYVHVSTFDKIENGIEVSSGSYLISNTLQNFTAIGTTPQLPANKYGIKGGAYLKANEIVGTATAKYAGYGIKTTNKDALIQNNTIQYVSGNAIDIDNATAGSAEISYNIIQGTGTNASSICIKANTGAKIIGNDIGNITGGDLEINRKYRNTGFAIQKGAYIARNDIYQNGAGAILADAGATVINNVITDNPGYGIQNGLNIKENQIVNSDTPITGFIGKDAIKADDAANVLDNTITNNQGYGINGGKVIRDNQIVNNNLTYGALAAAASFAITAKSGVNAVVENNTITYPYGFAILNGKTINNNTILGEDNNAATGSYGIKAEVGASVTNNSIIKMKGIGIENGTLIHNNIIEDVLVGFIKAEATSVITKNTLKNTFANNPSGYAISGGSKINFNSIKGINTGTVAVDLILSNTLDEFKNNTVGGTGANDYNTANLSILSVTKTTGSLSVTDNSLVNNRYKSNTLKLTSNNLDVSGNTITNNYNAANPQPNTGGFVSGLTSAGVGAALYLKANDANGIVKGNTVTGHLGYKDGAAFYIDNLAAGKIVMSDENVISNNHITDASARGAAVFHNAGLLEINENTLTFNSINTTSATALGSAVYSVPVISGNLKINNNIIAGNKGKWAIYGAPLQMTYNNLYDNTQTGAAENWPTVPGMNLRHNATYAVTATNNFWGNRSDLGQIDPSIWDDNEAANLGIVTYQPILSGPSDTTPGVVSNISAVKVTLSDTPADVTGIINLPAAANATGTPLYITIQARDNNTYSNDYTEVIIHNIDTNQYIRPLLKEVGLNTNFNTEVYKAMFKLSTTATAYDPVNNILPVTGGDRLRIYSVTEPNNTIQLIAAQTGNSFVDPNISAYNFGTWQNGSTPLSKKFTITNSGSTDLALAATPFPITGANAALFSVSGPAGLSVIPAGSSFDIIVRYLANAGNIAHSATVTIDFSTDGGVNDRAIDVIGETVAAWPDPFDPFGEPQVLTNNMTFIINPVKIDGTTAVAGDMIAAYVISGNQEVLRGKATVQAGGLATLVVNSETANETIFFKIWDTVNHEMYNSPTTVLSAPGTTVNSRAPFVIDGVPAYTLVGSINDGTLNLPGFELRNIHANAPVNPASNQPYVYVTDATAIGADVNNPVANFMIEVWKDAPVILKPSKAGYTFVTSTAWVAQHISANNAEFTYGASATTYPTSSVYYNAAYRDLTTQLAIDATTPNLEADQTALNYIGTIETFVVSGNITLGQGTMPLANVTMTVTTVPVNSGAPATVTTDSQGNFFFTVNSGATASLTFTTENLNAAGYSDVAIVSPLTLPINSGNAITSDQTGIEFGDNNGFNRQQIIYLKTGWNLISFNVDFSVDPLPGSIFGNPNAEPDDAIVEVRDMTSVWIEGDPGNSTLTTILPGKGYYVKTSADVVLTVSGKVAKQEAISLLTNNWNLVGYNMTKQGQTRTMLNNDENITYLRSLSEAYFYSDNPVGSSTLRVMKPGQGYWLRTADLAQDTYNLNYETKYNDLIENFEFKGLTNQANAFGRIEKDYLGLPLVISTETVDATALEANKTYTIATVYAGVPVDVDDVLVVENEVCQIVSLDHSGVALADIAVGSYYRILTIDGTDFEDVGAPNGYEVGTIFKANDIGANLNPVGTGTVGLVTNFELLGAGANFQVGDIFTRNDVVFDGPTHGPSSSTVGVDATDFEAVGAADNEIGTVFIASGAGSGSGTASINTTSSIETTSNLLVIGETYKILTSGTGVTDWADAGAVGYVGEIFTAKGVTDQGTVAGTVRNLKSPKIINVNFSFGQNTTLLPVIEKNSTVFTDAISRFLTAGQFATLVTTLNATGSDLLNWTGFLTALRTAGEDATVARNYLGTNYLIFASQTLADDTNQQQAQVVVYQVNGTDSANTVKTLDAIAIRSGAAGTTLYRGVQNGNNYYITVPNDFDPNGKALEFSVNGAGLYPNNDADTGDRLVSGTATYTYLGNLPYTVYVKDAVGTDPTDYQAYNIYVSKLPAENPVVFARNDMSRRNSSQSSKVSMIDRDNDPFGTIQFQTNSHLVLAKITANGAPVNPNYIVAAYVGNELRGKQQVVMNNGMTYVPILVSTVTPGELITFKLWKEGSQIVTFNNTLTTIPGGTTGNTNGYYQFNINAVDNDEVVQPLYKNELSANYPNPFNPTTTIEFSLKETQNVSLEVFNIKGQKVKTLAKGQMEKGRHKIVWDGKNDHGQAVGSGIYFYKMDTKGYNKVRKALLLK